MSKKTNLVNFYFTKEEMRQMMVSYLVLEKKTSSSVINHISNEENDFMIDFDKKERLPPQEGIECEYVFSFDGEIEEK